MEVGKVINGILENREKNGYNKAITDICNYLTTNKICDYDTVETILKIYKK